MRHWEEIPKNKIPQDFKSQLSLSIIIVARNEEENIVDCINSILINKFPTDQYEIIVVDDHSDDKTAELVQSINNGNIKLLSLAEYVSKRKVNAFKKEAIRYALEHAQFDYILHTDADCIVPPNWLSQTAFNFENKIELQAAPIGFLSHQSFLHWFQQLDMFTLMASTNAGIRSANWYLANGANLAYKLSSLPANIYEESDQYASGDDVFLINKLAEKKDSKIIFEPSILVKTKAVDRYTHFFNQRIRWAGKNKSLAKGKMKNILLIPVLANLWIFVLLFYSIFDFKLGLTSLLFYCMIKWMIDYVILHYMQNQLNPHQKNQHFLLASICYPFYILGVGIVSLFTKSYLWKARRVH